MIQNMIKYLNSAIDMIGRAIALGFMSLMMFAILILLMSVFGIIYGVLLA